MSRVSALSMETTLALQDKVMERAAGCGVLEEAAQGYMSVIYEALRESVVLARLFATIPYRDLPEPNKEFVTTLACSAGIADLIEDTTLVLSLLGSRGDKPEWNDRRQSKGHVGIPLVSSDFISRIPMMSRLLKQLGAGLDWIDVKDTALVARTFEDLGGVFYVRDAASELDSEGRKIIAAQDFVDSEGVKTVFGIGGCYMGTSMFFSTIVFLREAIDKEVAERFMLQAYKFKTATLDLVDEGKFFA